MVMGSTELPADVLIRLLVWCVYIELQGTQGLRPFRPTRHGPNIDHSEPR